MQRFITQRADGSMGVITHAHECIYKSEKQGQEEHPGKSNVRLLGRMQLNCQSVVRDSTVRVLAGQQNVSAGFKTSSTVGKGRRPQQAVTP